MSRCPQCKTTLPTPEVDFTAPSSRHSRSSGSAQQAAAKVPLPALTGPSKRPVPASTLFSSARSSKQLRPASRTELQVSDIQQSNSSIPAAASSNQSHQTTEAPILIVRHPPMSSSDLPTTGSIKSSTADSTGQYTTSAQTPSTGPSSVSLATSDGRRPHSGKIVHLDLQPSKKPRPRNQGGRPPGESPRHAEWMRTADIMLEEVPSGRHWGEKITRMDSSIVAAVAMSATPVPEGDVSLTEDVERKELIRLVRRFAERHSEGRVNFEHFILVCLCKVLSSQGVSQGKIVETLQICISDTSKVNIYRYLKGATWANKMMNELFFTDWGYRAVDLIAICKVLGSSDRSSAELLIQGTDLSPHTARWRQRPIVASISSQN